MAHQTNVHIVHQNFQPENPSEKVVDPVCGMEMNERESKHMVFRKEATFFFCSRECKDKFIDPTFKKKEAA